MNEKDAVITGRGWNEELKGNYKRLPECFKIAVPDKIWNLSSNSAGLTIKFFTNSRNLQVKYTIAKAKQLPNMSRLNQEGIDLYATSKREKTHWIGNHMQWNWGDTLSFTFRDLETKEGTYELFLPPYNTVTSLKIGSDKDAMFRFMPIPKEKAVVIYGSSIVQGASPSRPGLTWTNMLKRLTGYNVVNLGFSGSCLMESALFDALSEIDARCFIIDPIPNSYPLTDEEIGRCLRYVILRLRSKSKAPILVSESYPQMDIEFNPHAEDRMRAANKVLYETVKQLQKEGVGGLYDQFSNEIKFVEDAMIEVKHPNDIGCVAYAQAYERKLREIFIEVIHDK